MPGVLLLDLAATRAKKDHTEALHVLQASNEGTRLGADLQRLRLDLENEKRTTAITMEHSNQVRLDDHALRAEVQRLKDELTTMHAQSETEKRAIISEWQATRDNMAANHLQDVMKLSNEARDKQLALGREHEEILARTDHQHRMQMQDKEREFTEKMAEAAKQLKDELTRDKMQWMAQNAATESDLITIAEIARARGVECSPCMLRAVDRVFRHRMRAVTIVTICERMLRCSLKILIFSGISDIYLQLIWACLRRVF